MKRSATNLSNTVKKVRFNQEVMDSTSSEENQIPPHYFHLGGENYVVVSDFSDVMRVHIRHFWRNKHGRLVPTKTGITMSPVLWQSLAHQLETLGMPSKCQILEEKLMISPVCFDDAPCITMQRFFQRNDFIRVFAPSICLLTEREWQTLKDIHKDVTADIISILFGRIFRKMILKEVNKQRPASTTDSPLENSDAEMVLTTSMIELLKSHLESNIDNLFHCFGCEENYENQLGHDCMTMNYDSRLFKYGDIALFSLDLELLASEFIQQNVHVSNYITENFLCKLDMFSLLRNAKELYVASDPCPQRMF